eukprot:COSAG01_NODE_1528_length_10015_cov_7.856797_10_plen_257_part_00
MVAVSDRVCPQVDAELAREREQLEMQKQQKLRARQDAARLAEQQAGELEAAQRKRAEMERQLAERQAETERMGGDVESIKRAAEENRIRRVGAPVAACRVCVARPCGLECGCPAERVALPGANAHPRRRCGGGVSRREELERDVRRREDEERRLQQKEEELKRAARETEERCAGGRRAPTTALSHPSFLLNTVAVHAAALDWERRHAILRRNGPVQIRGAAGRGGRQVAQAGEAAREEGRGAPGVAADAGGVPAGA